ncbi:MAG: thioredoxin family protein [Putridiphycobacter sp.]
MLKPITFALILGVLLSCGQTKPVAETPPEETTSETTTTETVTEETVAPMVDNSKINWMDFETAIEANQMTKKFIFIDVYTQWCGWCKKMDASTFMNPNVVAYMNEHFYAVKMDAESKDPIPYKDKLYEYKQYNARSGYNTLAVSLLDSQMSFPSFVVLNKREVKLGKIIGYKDANAMLQALKGFVE